MRATFCHKSSLPSRMLLLLSVLLPLMAMAAQVPPVIGLGPAGAQADIRDAGLSATFAIGRDAPSPDQALRVYSVVPRVGTHLDSGDSVTVKLYAPLPQAAGRVAGRKQGGPVLGHSVSPEGVISATDLKHGEGTASMGLMRIWRGDKCAGGHVGNGWCDLNDVRISTNKNDRAFLWRGGGVWRVLSGGSGAFSDGSGMKAVRAGDGWSLSTADGSKMEFNSEGRLIREVTPFGSARTCSYDAEGRLTEVAAGERSTLRYEYGSSDGMVSSIAGPEGLKASYTYDGVGRLVSVVNAHTRKIDYQYDADNNLVSAQDSIGGVLNVADLPPPQEAAAEPPVDLGSMEPLPEIKLDGRGLMVEKLEAGQRTKYDYGDDGQLTRATGPDGVTRFEYDAYGRMTHVIQPDNRKAELRYNALGLPTRIEEPDGTWLELKYDKLGNVTAQEESSGRAVAYTRDDAGRVTEENHSSGLKISYTYDAAGNATRTDVSTGEQISCTYDGEGRVTAMTSSTGGKQTWQYDEKGRVTEMTDVTGLRTRYAYDGEGRLATLEDSVRGTTRYRYGSGRRTLAMDGVGDLVQWVSPWGDVLGEKRPGGHAVQFDLNDASLVTRMNLHSGAAWSYGYDDAGNLVSMTSPSGVATVINRDGGGRPITITRGGVEWRNYTYDSKGRLTREESRLGTAASMSYARSGLMRSMKRPSGSVAFSYDGVGRLTSEKASDYTVALTYHDDDSLASMESSVGDLKMAFPQEGGRPVGITLNGMTATYSYGGGGLVNAIALPGDETLSLTRDEAGRVTKIAHGNSLVQTIEYDSIDRRTAIVVKADGDVILEERYEYDGNGNLSRIDAGGTTLALGYSDEDQLLSVAGGDSNAAYTYDRDGHMVSQTMGGRTTKWVVDDLGRPLRSGDISYNWDDAGNLADGGALDSRSVHTFDAADRLVTRKDGELEIEYTYRANGERLSRKTGESTTAYLYGPESLLAMKDADGTTWLIVTIPGTDWPVAVCGSNGRTYGIVADHLHTVRRTVDTKGKVVASSDYGPYGQSLTAKGTAPFASFVGMVVDPDGLYYARQRYYDPELARFLSMDPELGAVGKPGSHDMYGYAAGNPLRYRDPHGTNPGTFGSPVASPVNRINISQILREEVSGQIAADRSASGGASTPGSSGASQRVGQNTRALDGLRSSSQSSSAGQSASQVRSGATPGPNRGADTRILKNVPKGPPKTTDTRRFFPRTIATRPPPAPSPDDTIAVRRGRGAAGRHGRGRFVQRLGQALRGTGKAFLRNAARMLSLEVEATFWTAYSNYEWWQTVQAGREEGEAGTRLNKWLDKFAQQLQQFLDENPDRIIPRHHDGTPYTTQELQNLILINIQNGRDPFGGLVHPPGETVDPDAKKGYTNAVAKADGLLAQAEALRREIDDEIQNIGQLTADVREELSNAYWAADDMERLIERRRDGLKRLEACLLEVGVAMVGEPKEKLGKAFAAAGRAEKKAKDTATKVKGYAHRCDTGYQNQQTVDAWRADASKAIGECTRELEQGRTIWEPATAAYDALKAALLKWETYEVLMEIFTEINTKLSDANEAFIKAHRAIRESKETIEAKTSRLEGIVGNIKSILTPYAAWDDDVLVTIGKAEALLEGIAVPSTDSIEPMIKGCKKKIDTVRESLQELNLESITQDHEAEINEAKDSMKDMENVRNETGRLVSNAYIYLGQALRAYSRIRARTPPQGGGGHQGGGKW